MNLALSQVKYEDLIGICLKLIRAPSKVLSTDQQIPKVYEGFHLTMSWMTILTRVSGAKSVVLWFRRNSGE
jgi:hypothetical protein